MLTKKRSGNWAMGKTLLALPVIIATGLIFSATTYSLSIRQEKNKKEPVSLGAAVAAPDTVKKADQPAKKEGEDTKTKFVVIPPDEQPTYPGGDKARIRFLLKNIKYPETAKRDNIQGKVFISFNVEVDGSLTDVKVLRGIRKDCDEEAMRVIKLMPKWNPGKVKGENVKTSFVLPIQFRLDAGKPEKKKK